jgi:hypothetical protein
MIMKNLELIVGKIEFYDNYVKEYSADINKL